PAGYRKACAALVERFGQGNVPKSVFWAAWTCLLAPDAIPDVKRLPRMVETAFPDRPKSHDYLHVHGIALFRAGEYAQAVQRPEEAIKAHGRGGTAYDLFFLAMGYQRLDRPDDARQALARALTWLEQGRQGKDREAALDLSLWHNRLELELFQREAEA